MNPGDLLVGLTLVLTLGAVGQWLAWRLRIPAILPLLILGFLAGPVTGVLRPDRLLGELLVPVVSASVAIILFEGGLSLRFSDLRASGSAVFRLISLGVVVTWMAAAALAHLLVGLDAGLSLLVGAILVVTGPTVILPLLRQVRPVPRVGAVLRWEGIVNDPIGAVLAVLVAEVILAEGLAEGVREALLALLRANFWGLLLGVGAGWLATLMLARRWVPEYLHVFGILALVLATFTGADAMQAESGLLAVTVMGIVLANQRRVAVTHIIEFKENLGILLIAGLFIVLSARLDLALFTELGWEGYLFAGLLVVLVRPLAVVASTLGTPLGWRETLYTAAVAPRGIVAVAIGSLFALELEQRGQPGAEALVSLTMIVVVGTVTLYSLTALPLARLLGLSQSDLQGILVVGAHDWARRIARAAQALGQPALLVDTNPANIAAARAEGLPARHCNALAESVLDELDLERLGRMLALTANDEVNTLAALQFSQVFGTDGLYQLPAHQRRTGGHRLERTTAGGRPLFAPDTSYPDLARRFKSGHTLRHLEIEDPDEAERLARSFGTSVIPVFLQSRGSDRFEIYTAERQPVPESGQRFVGLFHPEAPLATRGEEIPGNAVG